MTPTWTVDRERILSRAEVQTVLAELKRKAKRSPLTRRNLIIFRLATCCGLRVSELTRLTLGNVRLAPGRRFEFLRQLARVGRPAQYR